MSTDIDIEFIGRFDNEQKDIIKNKVKFILDKLEIDRINTALEIQLVSDAEMQKVNYKYRNISKTTDVLSFPQPNIATPLKLLGTIIISPAEAKKRGEEILELVEHGLMHLLGYDHENDPAMWQNIATIIDHNTKV